MPVAGMLFATGSPAPFALNFRQADGGLAALYIVAGIAVLAVRFITNYQYRPQGTVAGVPAGETTTVGSAA